MVCSAIVRERVSAIQWMFTIESARTIDGLITFPSVDFKQVILSHENVLVLTLGIDEFDVRRILVNLGSSINLLQMLAYKQMDTHHLP